MIQETFILKKEYCMIKCKIVSIVILLLLFQSINPLGGGVFLYRYNQGGVEFLFALDPAHISQTDKFGKVKTWWRADRVGFEYPAGAFDATDNAISDRPHTFVHGAVREMLEELVFVPAQLLNASLKPYDMTTKLLDQNIEKQCINAFEKATTQNGIFFIYKPKVRGANSTPNDQTAVFFFDITDKCPQNLPEEILKSRINLQKNGFTLTGRTSQSIHAESIAIAWIKAKDILPTLNNQQNEIWVPFSQLAEHNEAANTLQSATKTDYPMIINHQNKTIRISNACMGMMQDRDIDQYNPQVNIAVIKKPSGDYIILHNGKTSTSTKIPPAGISSSMRSVIDLLQNFSSVLKFTSAPPPPTPPSSKFDVLDWIKKSKSQLEKIINDMLLENDIVDIHKVRYHTSLQHQLTPSLDAKTITEIDDALFKLIEDLRNKKNLSQPAKKTVHPHANQLLTQALELAALLRK